MITIINDQPFLETLLMELKGKSTSYSCFKKKEKEKKSEKGLISSIEAVEAYFSKININAIENLKEELNTIRKKRKIKCNAPQLDQQELKLLKITKRSQISSVI